MRINANQLDEAKHLRAVNAKLLEALEAFRDYPCQGDDCTTYPAGLCPGCQARAVLVYSAREANK